jgi:hypothetical protein
MPRLDDCHHHIVSALEKDHWNVGNRPEQFYAPDRTVFIDIRATRGTNGTSQQILLAEIKCFPDRNSTTRDLYVAFGQYILYRSVLAELQDPTSLYLVIPDTVYTNVFDQTAKRTIRDNRIKLIIVSLETETIKEWIE